MSSLSHHGIKGQKWGVRRYQNKDGTRTALGKHRDFERTASKVVDDLSNSPQPFIRRPLNKDKIRQRGLITQAEADQCAGLAAGVFKQASKVEPQITGDVIDVVSSTSAKMYGLNNRLKQPTSIAAKIGSDAKSDGVTFEQAANGLKDVIRYTAVSDSRDYVDTYNAIKQRLENKGYTEIKCKNYFQKYQNGEVMHKAVQSTFRSPDGVDFEFQFQTPESQAAKELKVPIYNERRKAGNTPERNMELEQKMRNLAEHVPDPEGVFEIKSHSGVVNSNKVKHTSIGGTMYIEGNALILGDSSYLEHHGIRGQRWGVRRFQNRDGSLTNAGRKRLGYATKGATQAVKKAFKAGTKTGAKAVKAVKAHYKKAEEKKIEKKKEKASKTRAGVSANKDLFTAKELKELNAKFEEQDKLTMARIKRGVEVAKAVGETAKSIGEVGKAYEALTGHKIVPDIVTLQNGGSIDFGNKDKDKDKDNKDTGKDKSKDTSKDKGKGNNPSNGDNGGDNDDPPKPPNGGGGGSGDKPNWINTPPDLPTPQSKSKWGDSDLQSQMEAAKKQASKAMKNAKLQEYIDAYNRDQNSEKNKELAARGQKAIEILSKGGGFNSEAPSSSPSPTPKAAPSSNNLMAQIRAAQAKLEKPNKNETPAEHKEAQKKLNALEKVANEYKAAANKPGTDSAEVAEKLLKKNKDILDDIKHMDFSDETYLEHYGVRGMKWGKHLMAGKSSGIYDGTALGAGGGGGVMTEEERKKAEELRKKKLEEAKKKAEEAAKDKEIEEKAKEIGISAKAYKRYSIDNNRLPGKHHYDKSQKLHSEASSSLAETQAAERQAHTNRAKAASLMRKVNNSHMFDADGYHISQQRGDDRKEAKQLKKEAKQLDKASKKALKKFYKKRYKADKERQKWQNSTSGKYHHMMRHYEIQNGVLFLDSSDYLSHHGVKGQKWGVRRFQNEDGTLTEKGRKHYEKALAKEKRKQVSSDAIRGTLERQHPFAVAASVALGATYAAMLGVASAAAPGAVVAGAAIAAAISGVGTHGLYSVSEAWEGRGTKMRSNKIAKYEKMLKQSSMEEGMYHVENGTLFIDAGEPYLEHHGVKGMKWGKHLMAGKGEAGAGGGSGEDDEKLKEMAKKAGMSVAEYKQKFTSKIGGAASKVGEKVYDAAGGKYKNAAEIYRKDAREESNEARRSEKTAHEQSAEAQSYKRKYGDGAGYHAVKGSADSYKDSAELHKSNAKLNSDRANSMQSKYEKSLAGKYDKMKADRARKKSIKQRQDKTFSGTSPKEKKRVARKDQYLALPEQKKRSRAYDNKAAETRRARAERLTRDSEIFNRAAEESKRKQNSALNKGNKREAEQRGKNANFAQDWAEEGRRGAKDWRTGRRTGKPVLRTDSLDQVKKQHDKTLSGKLDKARYAIQRGKQKVYNKKKKAKHSDDTNAVYTEGTKLVINSKWG